MNSRISVLEVRLIASNGDQVGVVDTQKALELAKEEELDLVEIVPNQTPPVCRIMDYGKFRFDNQKKAHAAKKKQKQTQVKEIKFRPNTEEADYQVKLKSITKFLNGGDKAKITMRFRGREIAHQVIGREVLDRVQKDLDEIGIVEQIPLFEGRQMVMVIAPKK
ncbi:MAG: translation initiation factor IF-3 [Gammaproteobacteria bacterium]|jgi:translation initiation factor IF-3|nr:translation initiation factor IF-3 [Gammaproteobacteria bacterium]MBT4461942.1 translation initiation factor IF-3 [Gammaproteobacteria bacterium]MBT4655143.1 translation initiation factor IF-3 [Gammaproteobacteria bacterium]MBT5116748.1 translation initiation factor IF-3 [Gammaproteobacteria bacterium]MBT5761395.1 translation initiation factor IF-3 [Gammaproteobacteria bacterium]